MLRKRYVEPIIHIAIWLILYLLGIVFIRNMGVFSKSDNSLILPITVGTIINALVFYSTSLYLIPRYAGRSNAGKLLLGFIIILGSFTVIETLLDYFFMVWVYSTAEESFLGQFVTNGIVHLVFVSMAVGYGFTRTWVKNEKLKQDLIREKLTAELSFLKTQLNPHFLFNVLNMAYSSASRGGDEKTADIIEKLSVLMRYMIYDSNVEKVEVDREIEFIRHYINLQKMRFSSDIPVVVNFDVSGDYSGYRIAPLILVSFIENAFKYGVKLEKKSEIRISMNFHNGEMEFVASNPIFKAVQPVDGRNSGIGINNTKKRLAILYPRTHKLSITDDGKEFSVRLILTLD
ncbi:MAG: histidine kinase, partial [Bacteroidales bacterium]|nr:histidine kinase [Bacteroidales bacterium]